MKIDDLEKGERIGSGSYGIVYKGIYKGQVVAIKKFKLPGTKQEYSKCRTKCLNEADTLKSLRHENIVRFIDIVEMSEKKSMCIIMEYIDGGTMQRFCQADCVILSDADKNRIACSCWSGLAYLHEQKIIHKDIKPENIFVSKSLMTKIGDFGFAERKDRATLYSTKTLQGTLWYAPPELAAKGQQKRYSRHPYKSDVYSMGVTLCEFYSGQPFRSHENPSEDSNDVPPDLEQRWAEVQDNTDAIEPICWKAISVDIQNILIYAIAEKYWERKAAYEMLELFKNVNQYPVDIDTLDNVNVLVMFLLEFCFWMALGCQYLIIPFLGESLHLNTFHAGAMIAAMVLSHTFYNFLFESFFDRLSKKFLIMSCLLSSIMMIFTPFSNGFYTLLITRTCWIHPIIHQETLKFASPKNYLWINQDNAIGFGAAFGLIFTPFMAHIFNNICLPSLISGICLLLCIPLILVYFPLSKTDITCLKVEARRNPMKRLSIYIRFLNNRNLMLRFIFKYFFVNSQYDLICTTSAIFAYGKLCETETNFINYLYIHIYCFICGNAINYFVKICQKDFKDKLIFLGLGTKIIFGISLTFISEFWHLYFAFPIYYFAMVLCCQSFEKSFLSVAAKDSDHSLILEIDNISAVLARMVTPIVTGYILANVHLVSVGLAAIVQSLFAILMIAMIDSVKFEYFCKIRCRILLPHDIMKFL